MTAFRPNQISNSRFMRNPQIKYKTEELLKKIFFIGVMCTFLGVQTPPTPPTLMDSNGIFSLV